VRRIDSGGPRAENRPGRGPARRVAGPLAVISSVLAVMWPMGSTAPGTAGPSALKAISPSARTAEVGALFRVTNGHLGTHFCTASVVHSPAGNLLITAAHCVTGYSASPVGLVFVPAYNGTAPLGTWTVTRIFVDPAWASSADPDDDVAFLTVAPHSNDMPIENVTGADRIKIGQAYTGIVRVIGYPDSQNRPLTCENDITAFSPSQMEFDCGGYTDGTSGSPFLINVNPATGEGTLIGVIGGYEQGGYSADVSYAATFGQNVLALYKAATSRG